MAGGWFWTLLGKDGVNQLGVEEKHSAARVSSRPMELGTRGAYSVSFFSLTMAAGFTANAEIVQFRWTHATRLCLLRRVTCSGGGIAAFAAGFGRFDMMFARGWTVDGTGGATITFSTNNNSKKRTDFALSSLSDTGIRMATTTSLGAGTKTFDNNALAQHTFGVTATAGATLGSPGVPLWSRDTSDEYPVLFETNEGFSIRAVVPATGTWTFGGTIEWAEIDPADATGVDGWA